MKSKANIGWRIVKIILIILKTLFSKGVAFFVNFFIFMTPIAMKINFNVASYTIGFIAISFIVYPILFEIMYKYLLNKSVVEVHEMIDNVVHSIDNNFKKED